MFCCCPKKPAESPKGGTGPGAGAGGKGAGNGGGGGGGGGGGAEYSRVCDVNGTDAGATTAGSEGTGRRGSGGSTLGLDAGLPSGKLPDMGDDGDRWCGDELAIPLPKTRGTYTGDGMPVDAYLQRMQDINSRCALASRPTTRSVRFQLWNEVFEPGNLHKAPVHTDVYLCMSEEHLNVSASAFASGTLPSARSYTSVQTASDREPQSPTIPAGWALGRVVDLHPDGSSDVLITKAGGGAALRDADDRTMYRVPASRLKPFDPNGPLNLLQGRWYDGAGSAWDVSSMFAKETTVAPTVTTLVHSLVTNKPASSMVSLAGHRIRSITEDMVVWKNGEVWRRNPGFLVELSWEDSSVKWGDSEQGVVVVSDSPDAKGGELRAGDVLHALDGLCVLQLHHLCEFVRSAPGAKLKARICRPTHTSDIPVPAIPDEDWHPSSLRIGDRAYALWGGKYHPCTIMGGVPQHSQATALAGKGAGAGPLHKRTFSEPFDSNAIAQDVQNPLARDEEDVPAGLRTPGRGDAPPDEECYYEAADDSPGSPIDLAGIDLRGLPRCESMCTQQHEDSVHDRDDGSIRRAGSVTTTIDGSTPRRPPPLQPIKSNSNLTNGGGGRDIGTSSVNGSHVMEWSATVPARPPGTGGIRMSVDDATVVWDFDMSAQWKVPMAYLTLENPHAPVAGEDDPAAERVRGHWRHGSEIYNVILSYCNKPPTSVFTGAELLRELRLSRTAGKHYHLEGFQFREHQTLTLCNWLKWVGYLCEIECADAYFEWMEGQLRGDPPYRPPPTFESAPLGEQLPIADNVLTIPGRGVVVGSNGSVVRKRSTLNSTEVGFIPRDAYVDVVEISGRRARVAAPMVGWISLTSADGTILVAESPFGPDENSVSILRVADEPLGFVTEDGCLAKVLDESPAARCGMERFASRRICAVGGTPVAGEGEIEEAIAATAGDLLVDITFHPPHTVQLEYRKLPGEAIRLCFSPSLVLESVDPADLNHDLFARYTRCTLSHVDGTPVRHTYQLPLHTAGATAPVFTFILHGDSGVTPTPPPIAQSPAASEILRTQRRLHPSLSIADGMDAGARSHTSLPSVRSPAESLLGSPAQVIRRARSVEDAVHGLAHEHPETRGSPGLTHTNSLRLPKSRGAAESPVEFGRAASIRRAFTDIPDAAGTPLPGRTGRVVDALSPAAGRGHHHHYGDGGGGAFVTARGVALSPDLPTPAHLALSAQGMRASPPGLTPSAFMSPGGDMLEATPATPGTPPLAGTGRGAPPAATPKSPDGYLRLQMDHPDGDGDGDGDYTDGVAFADISTARRSNTSPPF